jgi:OFA family oxalate/formate antiporter-like MFS transporter
MTNSTSRVTPPNGRSMTEPKPPNRWIIALASVWLQLFLGTVYAWSYFQKPIGNACHWNDSQVAWTFSFAICFLGLAAAWGGTKLPRFGPRRLAVVGSVLFGAGYLLAAAALKWHSLLLLYVGYGAVGGTGLGLCYVTPVATVAKWFPDKKGLATGLVIMGFGFGALLMSKLVAPVLCLWSHDNLPLVFACLGIGFTAATLLGSMFLRNPPAGWMPVAARQNISTPSVTAPSTPIAASPPIAIYSPQFAAIWMIFFCNIVAGISIISFQSPIFQNLWHALDPTLSPETLVSYGAWLIAVTAVFNGVGRMFWGALSDRVGRLPAFRLMLGSQLAVFAALTVVGNPWLFGALICYVLLCYGGGFGTMPSLILDAFGPRRMAAAYGLILTAWSAGGIVGPQVIAACPKNAPIYSFFTSAGFLAVGLLLSLVLRERKAME